MSYCVLKDRKNTDPNAAVDVIARAEDASKIQRITERFRLAKWDENCGISDVLLALDWVKKNIEYFGGDPDQITVGGESAGAQIVAALMTMPCANSLFTKAIIESYPATGMEEKTRKHFAAALIDALGFDETNCDQIMNKTSEVIIEAINKMSGSNPLFAGSNLI